MDWLKRNLSFVIGSVVAVGLLLFSGFYLYSNSKKNSEARESLENEYNQLQILSNQKPHPGKGKVDNIKRAREQKETLLGVIERVRTCFTPIEAIPASPTVTGEDFSAALRRTIDELNRKASASSVIVPTNYNFSFEAEKRLVKFAPNSLNRLAVQLGEVKAICGVLFQAKVNKLTELRRERVSADDRVGPQSDYLMATSVTNELAVISPYLVSFESFSTELAAVIAGFANSPCGLVIRGVNVRPALEIPALSSPYGRAQAARYSTPTPIYTAPPAQPTYGAPTIPNPGRYGIAPGGGGTQIRRPTFRRPMVGQSEYDGYAGAAPPAYQPPEYDGYAGAATQPRVNPYRRQAYTMPGAAPSTAETLIDEHPLSVTLIVEVIKFLPAEVE